MRLEKKKDFGEKNALVCMVSLAFESSFSHEHTCRSKADDEWGMQVDESAEGLIYFGSVRTSIKGCKLHTKLC